MTRTSAQGAGGARERTAGTSLPNTATAPTTPHDKEESSGRYSGTEQQEAQNGGRQQGVPADKKPGVAGYRPDKGPQGGKVDGDAPRASKDDDKH